MANKKFSEFTVKTSTSDVDFVVGYDGTDNVRITPANLTGGGGASSLNGLTDCLVDTDSLYVGEVPAGLSGNPQANTILGIDAGNALTNGANNTLIGNDAGKGFTGGTAVFVGALAGEGTSTANATGCIAIGWSALRATRTGSDNVAVGFQAGRSIGNGAASNTMLGALAGYSNTGSNTVMVGREAGRNNTATGSSFIGYQAGYSNTSGTTNTNLGYQAGYSNTTGLDRVAIGYEAGKNQTGSYNVFVGPRCGKGSGTGTGNVAIGQGVMEASAAASNCVFIGNYMASNVTSGASGTVAIGYNCLSTAGYSGEDNTIVGGQAGNNLTSGDGNTLIGRQAGDALTTAGKNVLIGYQSGKALTAGGNSSSNVFVGYQTGFGANNANYNTLLGYQSGYGLTNGENNTIIGSFASAYTGALTTGDNNTIIGNAAYPSSATVSNEITLGNSSVSALRCAVTSITSLSDERDKSEIKDITYGLAFIDALQPREFVWNNRAEIKTEIDEDGNETEVEFYSANKGKKDFGFIAQEVKELDNETLRLVYDENPEKLELSYGKLVPVLVQAIKELKAEIELLKS